MNGDFLSSIMDSGAIYYLGGAIGLFIALKKLSSLLIKGAVVGVLAFVVGGGSFSSLSSMDFSQVLVYLSTAKSTLSAIIGPFLNR